MSLQALVEKLQERFGDVLQSSKLDRNQVTIEVSPEHFFELMGALRDEFQFQQLLDVCGVDYAAYGKAEWSTEQGTATGFSRGVEPAAPGRGVDIVRRLGSSVDRNKRFAAVYQLLSITENQRLCVRVFAPDDDLPVVSSVVSLWSSADWYEREAFDLFGIVFEGHPDLRRILTDYGFVGHPFRKDFPLIGNVEVRYDPDKARVVYEPVSIEPRVLVPRVIRQDHRYLKPEA
jgi:NADH-quinone oxidoreductase subunit C